jgi:hypothetical protein
LALLCLTSATAADAPSAKEILASAREQVARQELEVQGQLREGDVIVPFRLSQTGPVIRYSFTNPDEALQIRLTDSDSKLEVVSEKGVDNIAGAEFSQKVRGTAVSYEDLALRFIYWSNAKVLGDDIINTLRVWKMELRPPGDRSQYSRVLVWCNQKGGALQRMEGFDWNGRLTKRFEVVSVQDIGGRTFLKQMRIEEMAPETGKVRSRTYLEIKK